MWSNNLKLLFCHSMLKLPRDLFLSLRAWLRGRHWDGGAAGGEAAWGSSPWWWPRGGGEGLGRADSESVVMFGCSHTSRVEFQMYFPSAWAWVVHLYGGVDVITTRGENGQEVDTSTAQYVLVVPVHFRSHDNVGSSWHGNDCFWLFVLVTGVQAGWMWRSTCSRKKRGCSACALSSSVHAKTYPNSISSNL